MLAEQPVACLLFAILDKPNKVTAQYGEIVHSYSVMKMHCRQNMFNNNLYYSSKAYYNVKCKMYNAHIIYMYYSLSVKIIE